MVSLQFETHNKTVNKVLNRKKLSQCLFFYKNKKQTYICYNKIVVELDYRYWSVCVWNGRFCVICVIDCLLEGQAVFD